MECEKCGKTLAIGEWPLCGGKNAHGFPIGAGLAIQDDQLEGGARFFETMGPEPVYIESKSQWRREVAARNLENVVRHDASYYVKQRKMHDEKIRDERSL